MNGIDELQEELTFSHEQEREGFEVRYENGDFNDGLNPPVAPPKSITSQLESASEWPEAEADLINYKPFQDLANQMWEHQHGAEDKPRFNESGEQVEKKARPFIAQERARWAVSQMSWFEQNLTNGLIKAEGFQDAPMEHVRAFATAREMYKRTDPNTRQIVEGLAAMFADPLTYIGITTGAAVVGRAVGKKAMNEMLDTALKRYTASTVLGTSAGAAEGAAAGGLYGYNEETLLSTAAGDKFNTQGVYNHMKVGATVGAGLGLGLSGMGVGFAAYSASKSKKAQSIAQKWRDVFGD